MGMLGVGEWEEEGRNPATRFFDSAALAQNDMCGVLLYARNDVWAD